MATKLKPATLLKRRDVIMLSREDAGGAEHNRGPWMVEDVTPNYLTLRAPFEPKPITLCSAPMVVELLERPDGT